MFKMLLLLFGLGAGAGGATAWLLSEPEDGTGAVAAPTGRMDELKARFAAALDEGKRSGVETESRLKQRLDAQRAASARGSISR